MIIYTSRDVFLKARNSKFVWFLNSQNVKICSLSETVFDKNEFVAAFVA